MLNRKTLEKIYMCLNEINISLGAAMDLADNDRLSVSEEEELEDCVNKMESELEELRNIF